MDHFLLVNKRGTDSSLTFKPVVPSMTDGFELFFFALPGFPDKRFGFLLYTVIHFFSLLEKGIHGIALDQFWMKGLIDRPKGKNVKPHDPSVNHEKDSLLVRNVP